MGSKNYGSEPLRTVTFKCGICGKAQDHETDLLVHLIHDHAIHSNRDALRNFRYVCAHCNLCYSDTQYLNSHIALNHKTRSSQKSSEVFTCGVCTKTFRTKYQLHIHRRFHTKIKPYKCKVCDEAFCNKFLLKEHVKVVHPDWGHFCDLCKKTFGTENAAQIHRAEHFVWKPYLCPACGLKFRLYQQLYMHMSKNHDRKEKLWIKE